MLRRKSRRPIRARGARIAGVSFPSPMTTFSTTQAPPRGRAALWGDLLWNQFGSLQAAAPDDPQFDGTLVMGAVADLRVSRIDASRHVVIRTQNEVRRDGGGEFKLIAQVAGSACFEQGGRRVVLEPGDWSIYDTGRPYVVTNPGRVVHTVVLIPRERMRGFELSLDSVMLNRISGSSGLRRGAFDLLAGALHLDGGEDAARAADRIAGLVREAILEHAGRRSERSLRALMRDRVLRYVHANLRDPALNLDLIAGAAGCSKRYLHKLFCGEAETLGEYLWRARLARVREELSVPALRGRSITEIAFSWGFNSSAHFSRVFRDRYGLSPRSYRARLREAPAD